MVGELSHLGYSMAEGVSFQQCSGPGRVVKLGLFSGRAGAIMKVFN